MASMKAKHLKTPLSSDDVKNLSVGDVVFLSGKFLTARDKAHKKIIEHLREGKKLPFSLEDAVLYHCGPLVSKKKQWKILSAGPTTSARMNKETPEIIERFHLKAIAGKGGMNKQVSNTMKKSGCVYLAFTGGAGALAAEKIKKVLGVFWLSLSTTEAVWLLEVSDFGPLVVAMDASGRSLYSGME